MRRISEFIEMKYFLILSVAVIASLKADLLMEVKPPDIIAGLTRQLSVNCSFTRTDITNMVKLFSLVITQSNDTENLNFYYQASVDELDGLNNVTGNVSGHLDNRHESYIAMKWDTPRSSLTGWYSCEANGESLNGQVVKITKTVKVQISNPTIEDLLDVLEHQSSILEHQSSLLELQFSTIELHSSKIETQSSKIDLQSSKIENQFSVINLQSSKIENQSSLIELQSSQISKLQQDLDQIGSSVIENCICCERFNESLKSLYRISALHNGSRYYLSPSSKILLVKEAEAQCELMGGYLTEMDSEQEYLFVKSFVKNTTGYDFIFIGGNDEVSENAWVNTYSKTPVKYIKWGPQQPDQGRAANCLSLWEYSDWTVADDICYQGATTVRTAYLCEVPE